MPTKMTFNDKTNELRVPGELDRNVWLEMTMELPTERSGGKLERLRVVCDGPGGNAQWSYVMAMSLRDHAHHVETEVRELAASAHTLLYLAGQRRVMRAGARLAFHAPFVRVKHGRGLSAARMQQEIELFIARSEELARQPLPRDWFRPEMTYVPAAQVLALGLADEVI